MAVLILAGSQAISVSAQMAWLAIGIFVSAAVAAIGQWVVSSKTKRETARKLVRSAAVIAAVYIVWDCGWMPDWLCFAFL